MNISIQTQGFRITPSIGARVHQQVRKALRLHVDDVVAVEVFLRDLNGPKGGPDKQAGIRVHVRHLPQLSVTTTDTDLYRAIDAAALRAGRSVKRSLGRFRRIRRRGLQHLGAMPGRA